MNAMTVYQLIRAKQSQQPFRLSRDMGLALVISLVAIIISLVVSENQMPTLMPIFSIGMLLVAMGELGSHTFDEYKDKRNAYVWLMLPATTSEKWLSNFVMSFLIVPLIFIGIFTGSVFLAKILVAVLGWPIQVNLFNPFSVEGWELLKGYWYIHPLYFFGAIYFKNRVVMKTTAALFLLIILWLIFSVFFADLFISSQVENTSHLFVEHFNNLPPYEFGPFILESESIQFKSPAFGVIFVSAFTISYFAYFWGLSLLRFKELEL